MKTGSQRVQRHRDKLRAAGLRPIQIWVPNTRAPGFAEECARQCLMVAAAATEESKAFDTAWADLSDTTGWTA